MQLSIIRGALRQRRGSVAAEMALIMPLFFIISFGAAEIGYLFYSQHILTKAVRDGARYAARQPFADYDMGACALSSDAETRTRRLIRTAQLASAGSDSRLPNWDEADEPSTIDIDVVCDAGGSLGGVYVSNANVAASVAVRAQVPYTPLIGSIGFNVSAITLSARSEAAVTGI